MRYIKTFESHYEQDEYVYAVTDILKSFNLRPIQINDIIKSYSESIDKYQEQGKSPQDFINDIKGDLNLTSGGDFMSISGGGVPGPLCGGRE